MRVTNARKEIFFKQLNNFLPNLNISMYIMVTRPLINFLFIVTRAQLFLSPHRSSMSRFVTDCDEVFRKWLLYEKQGTLSRLGILGQILSLFCKSRKFPIVRNGFVKGDRGVDNAVITLATILVLGHIKMYTCFPFVRMNESARGFFFWFLIFSRGDF